MIRRGLPAQDEGRVLVVGAGPAGIVVALELRRRGVPVTLITGGEDGFDAGFQALADAAIADPRRHAPMAMAVRRGLGGTSLLWGGRCVAFDVCDFAARPHVPHSVWPLGPADVAPWTETAIRYLDAGEPVFSAPIDPPPPETECRFDQIERWSEARNLRRLHAEALERDPGLDVCLGITAVGIDLDPASGKAAGLDIADLSGARGVLHGRAIVLACGGLETTRLLLAAQVNRPHLFGGDGGPLGRYYMGHLEGRIAEIVFDLPGSGRAFDFHVDAGGRYVRRRITVMEEAQRRHGLLNLAVWPDNPALGEPGHKSAILSLAYLALAAPGVGSLLAPEAIRRKHLDGGVAALPHHLGNILCGAPAAAREATRYLWRRYAARPRLPGFFIPNRGQRYALFYHAEQAPNPDSRVRLGDERDALGLRRLTIDLRYGEIDARSVVASHAVIGRALRQAGIGRLDYTVPEAERIAHVLEQATDGYHQIGTARMADSPADGVVDRDCRVHGTANLYVASSAVFPTSGQANPTLLLAALSARLAAHLARELAVPPAIETGKGRPTPATALPAPA